MQYALHCNYIAEKKYLPPKSFQMFLSGGAVIGKNFIIKAISEYLEQVLRYPNQHLDQLSVLVTASTGKAAACVTNYSVFYISSSC